MNRGDLPFRVGAARAEITPPLEVGLLMSAAAEKWEPFKGVRSPLHARALVIEGPGRRIALVSLDLLGISGKAFGGRRRFEARVAAASNRVVRSSDLILTATHTHSAPETLALTGLYRTPQFKRWVGLLAERIGGALHRAVQRMEPACLGTASAHVLGLAIHRRIKTTRGVVLSHPEPPPETVTSREGALDPTVNVAVFLGHSEEPMAILANATCHPVHEMCIPMVSSDYPGEMCRELESGHPEATALFLGGAAGNINPPTVSGGPDDAQSHGKKLAQVAQELLGELEHVDGKEVALLRSPVSLPGRTLTGRPSKVPLTTELTAVRLGSVGLAFIPGEPFVEIGLGIRQASPFEPTWVVGCAGDYIGYIPTDAAFDEGGYELGPGPWARVGRGSEGIIRREALALLRRLR